MSPATDIFNWSLGYFSCIAFVAISVAELGEPICSIWPQALSHYRYPQPEQSARAVKILQEGGLHLRGVARNRDLRHKIYKNGGVGEMGIRYYVFASNVTAPHATFPQTVFPTQPKGTISDRSDVDWNCSSATMLTSPLDSCAFRLVLAITSTQEPPFDDWAQPLGCWATSKDNCSALAVDLFEIGHLGSKVRPRRLISATSHPRISSPPDSDSKLPRLEVILCELFSPGAAISYYKESRLSGKIAGNALADNVATNVEMERIMFLFMTSRIWLMGQVPFKRSMMMAELWSLCTAPHLFIWEAMHTLAPVRLEANRLSCLSPYLTKALCCEFASHQTGKPYAGWVIFSATMPISRLVILSMVLFKIHSCSSTALA
ncbi:hypothetical protein BKA70DRAFT_1463342 [Coprinopsis sp. MPI-PUGE-AT-0042]|nr:hypothetical protein BKA70DRAFT_1463342 [Coprinopsis sp. MPI-PUGE-AT-0042]